MESPATNYLRAGPWNGIDEAGRIGDGKVRDGLNVVFRDGKIMRRPGRVVVATDASGRRVAGLHEHVSATGQRKVLAYLDPVVGTAEYGALVEVNWNTGALSVVVLFQQNGGDARSSAAVAMDGHTILADPAGALYDYNGSGLDGLAAVAGNDAALGVESYLAAPPYARSLVVWRDRIVAAGDPRAPRTIALSENKWNLPNIPDSAPIGGANVWPQRTNFDLNTDDGAAVEAVTVLHDRLTVLHRSGVSVVDEDGVGPYARHLAHQHGCIAPRSVVNTGQFVIYLGERQVYLFDGSAAVPIGGDLGRTLTEIVDWDSAHLSVGVNLRHSTEYRLWVPVKGLKGNALCLIYNYAPNARTWRKASHWYLFDESARRDLTYAFDVTCALSVILENGREVLLTGDSAGRIYLEDVGEDDNGQIFPAFVALGEIDNGSQVETFSDWSLDCLHDGSWIACLGVTEGRTVEQEIERVLLGLITGNPADDEIPYVLQQALLGGQQTWAGVAAWPMDVTGPQRTELRFGLRQRSRKMQPVLLLPGKGPASLGTPQNPSPGGIGQVEIGLRPRHGRR